MILLNKNIVFIYGLVFVLAIYNARAQQAGFRYKQIEAVSAKNYFEEGKLTNVPKDAFQAETVIKRNATISVNTANLQKAIDQNQTVILPNYPIMVAKLGITLRNNSTLIFQKNSKLQIEPNALEYYELLKIHDVSNVKILNAQLKGDRDKHLGKSGEWGYGISLRNARNVVIQNFKIEKFWGDGIAIGYGSTATNKNITIKNGILDFNRRNGLSIMNVDGLEVSDVYVANTYGTKPMFGIDFEPNTSKDNINNVYLRNIYSYNNANGGFMLTFSNLKSKEQKQIGLSLENFVDKGSPNGIVLAGVPKGAEGLKGQISLKNIVLDGNIKPITGREINNSNVNIDIQDLKIQNPKNKNIHHKEVKRVFDLKKNYSIKFAE